MFVTILTCHGAMAQLEVSALLTPVVPRVTSRALHHRVLGTLALAINMINDIRQGQRHDEQFV